VDWGVANPGHRKVLAQLEVSDWLSLESKRAGSAPFAEIQTMAQEAIAQTSFGIFPKNLPVARYSSGQGI
jgi:hypothetical protein